MKTFTSGAKSSEAAPRYDLIPIASLQRQAARMAQGAVSHGERNYRKGVNDPVFIRDRINHLIQHALNYAAGDVSDDHLGAVLANAGMLADLEALQDSQILTDRAPASIPDSRSPNGKPSYDERYLHATPAACGCPCVTYPPGRPCLRCQREAPANGG